MSATQRTILVVDDSELCRELVRIVLQGRGHQVVALDTPFGFATTLAGLAPDLVLVDVNMPALHGGKLVEVALQKGLCTCPIVFHSDRPVHELQSLVLATGAAGFIQKTNDAAELVARVEAYLNGPPPKREWAADARGLGAPPRSRRTTEMTPIPRSRRTTEMTPVPLSQRNADAPPRSQRATELTPIPHSQRNPDAPPPSQRTVTSPSGWVRGKF